MNTTAPGCPPKKGISFFRPFRPSKVVVATTSTTKEQMPVSVVAPAKSSSYSNNSSNVDTTNFVSTLSLSKSYFSASSAYSFDHSNNNNNKMNNKINNSSSCYYINDNNTSFFITLNHPQKEMSSKSLLFFRTLSEKGILRCSSEPQAAEVTEKTTAKAGNRRKLFSASSWSSSRATRGVSTRSNLPSASLSRPATKTTILFRREKLSAASSHSLSSCSSSSSQPSASPPPSPLMRAGDGDQAGTANFASVSPISELPPPFLLQEENNKPTQESYRLEPNEHPELGYLTAPPMPPSPSLSHDVRQRAAGSACCETLQQRKPILCIHGDFVSGGDVHLGRNVFSHPLIVEAMETLFALVVVDEQQTSSRHLSGRTLVRILDPYHNDASASASTITMRSEGITNVIDCQEISSCWSDKLTRPRMIHMMIQALELVQEQQQEQEQHTTVPTYLRLLLELESGRTELGDGVKMRRTDRTCAFSVYDPAAAEVEFAGLEGVLATRTGCIEHHGVVEVTFDTKRLSYCSLVRSALTLCRCSVIYFNTNEERIAAQIEVERIHGHDCHTTSSSNISFKSYEGTMQPDCDPKHALRSTPFRFVPLTELQSTRVNRLIQNGRFNEATHLLSPKQGLILMTAMQQKRRRRFHQVIDAPLLAAWVSVGETMDPETAMEQTRFLLSDTSSFQYQQPSQRSMIYSNKNHHHQEKEADKQMTLMMEYEEVVPYRYNLYEQ